MAGKYERLAQHLAALPGDQISVELTFPEVDRLVGGLPPSARTVRQWWANSSHGQALAWREAGWHVETVDFAERWVRFARGPVGGSRADRLSAARPTPQAMTPLNTPPSVGSVTAESADDPVSVEARVSAERAQVAEEVAVSVRFSWQHLGPVTLDADGKVAFPRPLPQAPGLYRMHFISDQSGQPGPPVRFYFGETDNLRRRLGSNYRNPGPSQQTSLRVNEALRTHLAVGGQVTLAVALSVELSERDSGPEPLDLTRKAGRLLAESAALVLAQRAGVQLENLG